MLYGPQGLLLQLFNSAVVSQWQPQTFEWVLLCPIKLYLQKEVDLAHGSQSTHPWSLDCFPSLFLKQLFQTFTYVLSMPDFWQMTLFPVSVGKYRSSGWKCFNFLVHHLQTQYTYVRICPHLFASCCRNSISSR